MKVKDLPKIERPREKLARYGPGRLSNTELLAILLRTGSKNLNVIELSKKVLKKFGNEGISEAKLNDLKNTFGLGMAKASEIVACFELGRRFLHNKQSALLLSPKDVWDELKDIRSNKKEHFIIFYLDTKNEVVNKELISIGTLNANLVHPREVFEPAVKNLAAQIILSHNHPSGSIEPSIEDIKITEKLIQSGNILGIEVIDHIIVTTDSFYSFSSKKPELFKNHE